MSEPPIADPEKKDKSAAAGAEPSKEEVQVVLTPEDRAEVSETVAHPAAPAPAARPGVHVAENLLDIATGRVETAEERHAAEEQHDLNEAVHGILIVGLAVSTILMLIGVLGDLLFSRTMPTVEPHPAEIIQRIVELRPSGFMALGLLVLLATPIVRVVGSVIAFAYERDWRFAGITFLVLVIVLSSVLLGGGRRWTSRCGCTTRCAQFMKSLARSVPVPASKRY